MKFLNNSVRENVLQIKLEPETQEEKDLFATLDIDNKEHQSLLFNYYKEGLESYNMFSEIKGPIEFVNFPNTAIVNFESDSGLC
jgi:hypothetical protein